MAETTSRQRGERLSIEADPWEVLSDVTLQADPVPTGFSAYLAEACAWTARRIREERLDRHGRCFVCGRSRVELCSVSIHRGVERVRP